MNYYELSIIISPDLSEEEIKNFSQEITNYIQEENGLLISQSQPSKKKLSYPIKHKEMAYLTSWEFQLEKELIDSLEKKLKGKEHILRYLFLTKKPLREEKPPRKIISKEKKIKTSQKEKVELKEIEKKLDEILGE